MVLYLWSLTRKATDSVHCLMEANMSFQAVIARNKNIYSLVVLLGLLVLIWQSSQLEIRVKPVSRASHNTEQSLPRDLASNSTLGFQRILALSIQESWRTRGLKAAANTTDLDIEIPTQPFISDELVQAYENLGGNSAPDRPQHGSAKAWLHHLDMLKYVVFSGLSSVLIIEDDVDWDVTIHHQMKLVSDNVRAFTQTSDENKLPYGDDWDVLWLGHCGEITTQDTEKLEYKDDTLMLTILYAGWTKKWLKYITEGHRAVQHTVQTVCTFGYGVNRKGAQNILRLLSKGQQEAFDVGLMRMCHEKFLKCITVNPELMHHYNPKEGTGYVSPNNEANGRGSSTADEAFETLMGTTANIKNSARCAALFSTTCPQPPTDPDAY